jgi:hypothetical protein
MASEDCLSRIIPGVADNGLLVEVGVLQATNLVALAAMFPSMQLIGVDSFEAYTDVLHGNYTVTAELSLANLEIAKKKIVKSGYAERIELRVMHSELAATLMDDHSIDLVYLDKNFTFEEQIGDVLQWFPKVRPGGILAGHEAFTPEVMRATEEALQSIGVRPSLEVIENEVWYLRKQ